MVGFLEEAISVWWFSSLSSVLRTVRITNSGLSGGRDSRPRQPAAAAASSSVYGSVYSRQRVEGIKNNNRSSTYTNKRKSTLTAGPSPLQDTCRFTRHVFSLMLLPNNVTTGSLTAAAICDVFIWNCGCGQHYFRSSAYCALKSASISLRNN